MNGWLITIGLVALHVLLVYFLVRSGKMEKWNLGLMLGIVVMMRTQKGRKLLDAIARPRRFWAVAGDSGTVVTLVGMALLTLLFFYSVYDALRPNSLVPAFSASEIFVIPGVNPFVPLWYGIAGLIVTLVVHEGGHGVLARANQMRVKSLGLLFAVVPIGAFVEPDDLDLKVASRRKRLRVFAAGPAVNIAFAAIFLVAFAGLMGSLDIREGAHVGAVAPDGPAQLAGLDTGDTIVSINGTATPTQAAYFVVMANRTAGENVTLGLADGRNVPLTLGSQWDRFSDSEKALITSGDAAFDDECRELYGPDAKSGAACAEKMYDTPRLGIGFFDPAGAEALLNPLGSGLRGFSQLAAQPVIEIRSQPILSVILPEVTEAPFHAGTFWILANLAFWCFWLNLMVGITNMLPMLPLDGGHVFRDAVGGIVQAARPRLEAERREKIVNRAAGAVSITVLTAFILMLVGPHLL